jgi:hypothetical protein
MRVRFGSHAYDFPGSELRELRESNDILDNPVILRERMADDGYLFISGLIDRDRVLAARARILRHMDEQGTLSPNRPVLDGVMPPNGKRAHVIGKRGISHDPAVRGVLESRELFEFWHRFYNEPVRTFDYKWLRAVANEEYTGCHYDVVYMGRGSRRLHTCWLPLADLPIEHGTLCICVGSHNLPSFARVRETYGNMDVDRDLVDGWFSNEPSEITERFGGHWATTNFRAGDMLAFGLFTMHASTTNMTDRWRISCDVRYQPAADSIDERWIGESPLAHYALDNPANERLSMSDAREKWGV